MWNIGALSLLWPCSSTDTTTAWKKSFFILSERSNFDMLINLSIAIHALWMLTLLTVDEIMLQRERERERERESRESLQSAHLDNDDDDDDEAYCLFFPN